MKKETPKINAGSMADIAFLLLIFFLVTTTMDTELGILKRLPEKQQTLDNIPVNERNVFEISINNENKLMVENSEEIEFIDLRQRIIDFIDNGGGTDIEGNPCDWCDGEKIETSSDHPAKAVITLESGRNTSYGTYVTVQNELNAAYNELRNKLSRSMYGITFNELEKNYKNNKSNTTLKEQIETIKKKYPVLISEKELEK